MVLTAEVLQRMATSSASANCEAKAVDAFEQFGLGGYNCKICNNSGTILRRDEQGRLFAMECDCMNIRRSYRAAKNSGMLSLMERCTFDAYNVYVDEQAEIKEKAKEFCHSSGNWLYISGNPGSGKTHICSAVCRELIYQGKYARYMAWRDESSALKSLVGSSGDYEKRIKVWKETPVLFIDDFFKSAKITEADVNLAMEIINYRYNNPKLITIISSELSLDKVVRLDGALGGRIMERTGKTFNIVAPAVNMRA